MSNITDSLISINYISLLKKIFVGRNNQPIYQKFKIDTNISDDYYFQIVSKNNQLVSLAGRSFKIYGSFIDNKREIHILFFTESYSIEDNILHFHLNTNTNLYNQYVTSLYKEIQLTIIETTGGNTQVVLRDSALAYRRPYIDNDTQVEIVYRDILTGINVPLTGSFGAGTEISLVPGVNSYAFGDYLTTVTNQTIFGKYNALDAQQAFVIGNGDQYNKHNLFTISFDGTAYLSEREPGAGEAGFSYRILTDKDRRKVSELTNDIGYVTLADIPALSGDGNGIVVSNNTVSLQVPVWGSFGAGSRIFLGGNEITGFAFGQDLIVDENNQFIIGTCNDSDRDAIFIVGNSNDPLERSNAFTVGRNGAVIASSYWAGDLKMARLIDMPSAVSQLTNDTGYLTSFYVDCYDTSISHTALYNLTGITLDAQDFELYEGTTLKVRPWFIATKILNTNVMSSKFANYAPISSVPTSVTQLDGTRNLVGTLNNGTYISKSESVDMVGNNPKTVSLDIKMNTLANALSSTYDFAKTSQIPTNVSQLTNDTGFITGYTAGSGISINNGVIDCTVDGATYTAGNGISIDSNNVISLTATIPTSASQLTNDDGYINRLAGYNGIFVQPNDQLSSSWSIQINDTVLANMLQSDYGFATTGQIPTSASQLTNDIGLLSSINVYNSDGTLFTGTKLKFGSEFVLYYPLSDTIEIDPNDNMYLNVQVGETDLGKQRSISFSNDFVYNYENGTINLDSSALTGISTDKLQNIVIDDVVQDSGFVMQYNPSADIVYNKILVNDGILNLNTVSGFENDIVTGKVATFENWIYPSGTLTGVTFASGLNFIGELPSSFTSGNTQVFTRRIIRKDENTTIQQISYNYEFEDSWPAPPPTPIDSSTPLTFENIDESGHITVTCLNANSVYMLNDSGVWSSTAPELGPGDKVAISSNFWPSEERTEYSLSNDTFSYASNDYPYPKLKVYGNIMSIYNWVSTPPRWGLEYAFANDCSVADASELILAPNNTSGCYFSLFENNQFLSAAPSALPGETLYLQCYKNMFKGCDNLVTGPSIISATSVYDDDSFACDQMFSHCYNMETGVLLLVTDITNKQCFTSMFTNCGMLPWLKVHFTSWDTNSTDGDDGDDNGGWLYLGDVDNIYENKVFYKPASLTVSDREDKTVPYDYWTIEDYN